MRRDNRKKWAVYFRDSSELSRVNYAVQMNRRRGLFKPWYKDINWKEVVSFVFWAGLILACAFLWK